MRIRGVLSLDNSIAFHQQGTPFLAPVYADLAAPTRELGQFFSWGVCAALAKRLTPGAQER